MTRELVERILARGGVRIGGDAPWDPQVHDPRFYARVLMQGTLGLGESYMDGWWDCAQLDAMVARLLKQEVDHGVLDWRKRLLLAQTKLMNLQTVARAGQVAEAHYDLGNDFFEKMLGPSMTYSCAYWRQAKDLDSAQEAKLDLICRKLQLRRGERLLDIGCGWGTLARYAAERHGCEVVGITVSKPQSEYAAERTRGLPVRILLVDYRSEELRRLGPFDKIVSVGMFEHVGTKNYRAFMRIARGLLKDDGLFLLHTIGNDHSPTDAWVNRYIFPNGMLPSAADLASAVKELFVIEDWHSFGAEYDPTLMAWHANFQRHAAELEGRFPKRFFRMWSYNLLTMAGSFRARTRNQLWQLVLSKLGVPGGYASVR